MANKEIDSVITALGKLRLVVDNLSISLQTLQRSSILRGNTRSGDVRLLPANTPRKSYVCLLNEFVQKRGGELSITLQSSPEGYLVTVRDQTFGPFRVQKKKDAKEIGCRAFYEGLVSGRFVWSEDDDAGVCGEVSQGPLCAPSVSVDSE